MENKLRKRWFSDLRPAPRGSNKRCGDGVDSSICVPCILTVSDGIVPRDRAATYSTLEASIDDVSFASRILLWPPPLVT
jgi:hypothetical protein